MKLNLYIISDYLKNTSFHAKLTSDCQQCSLLGIVFYVPGMELKSDELYFIHSEELAQLTPATKDISFLSIGPELTINVDCDILYFDSCISDIELFNRIQQIFIYFNNWEETMYTLLSVNASLSDILANCQDIFDNPTLIATPDLRTLAYSEKRIPDQPLFWGDNEVIGSYCSEEEIEAFKYDPNYVAGISNPGPQLLNNEFFGFRHFYENIFLNGKYIARFVICETVRPIRKSDYPLLNLASQFVRLTVENGKEKSLTHSSNFDRVIKALLENKSLFPDEITQILNERNWNMHDKFLCFVIHSDYDQSINTQRSLCNKLETTLSDCVAMIYDEHIVFIANITDPYNRKEIMTELTYETREQLLKVGESNTFRNFSDLRIFYEQACHILRLGYVMEPTKWYYHFDNYALSLILQEHTSDVDHHCFCPESLYLLMEYDTKTGREYTNVLKVYLRNNMSVVHTTKELYVQRATLLYQIKRIREITGLDLNDPDVRLLLLNYFKLSDYQNPQ